MFLELYSSIDKADIPEIALMDLDDMIMKNKKVNIQLAKKPSTPRPSPTRLENEPHSGNARQISADANLSLEIQRGQQESSPEERL